MRLRYTTCILLFRTACSCQTILETGARLRETGKKIAMDQQLAENTVAALRRAGINFVTYLPETRLISILPMLEADEFFHLVAVASEAEAITIASGAAL